MPDVTIAKIAVSGIPFRLDRPFDYAIPLDMKEKVQPGVRVEVPFTRANRRTEGIVLALAPIGAYEKLKPISEVLDEAPILTQAQIKLALWMHERFFCTVYEAVKAMLPAGLWFKNGKRRVSDKYVTMAALAVPAEEAAEAAEQKRRRAPQQRSEQQSRPPKQPQQPSGQVAAPTEDQAFEDKLKQFMKDSDSRIADNRMYADRGRSRRRK